MADNSYTGVANLQANQAQQNVNNQTQQNRPTQTTPWGSTNWTQDANGNWTQNTSLNPTLGGTLNQQQQNNQSLTNTAGTLAGQVGGNLSQPMDWSGFMAGGDRVNGGSYYNDAATKAITDKFASLNNPEFARQEASNDQILRDRGFRPGDAGYDQQLAQLRQSQNQSRERSNLDAIIAGGAEGARMQGMDINAGNYNTNQRGSQIDEAMLKRGQPLAEYGAVRGQAGGEVQPPDMPNFSTAGLAPTPDLVGARTNELNLKAAKQGSLISGISGLTNAGSGGLFGSILGGVKGAVSGGAAGTGVLGTLGGAAKGFMSGMGLGGAGVGGAAATGATGALTAGAAETAAGMGYTGAAAGAAGGSGMLGTLAAAAPWVAAAIGVGAVVANNVAKSSPLDNSFDANSLQFTKPANFDGQKWAPEELNKFLGPALQVFAQTGDAQKALASIPQPTNAREQTLLKGGVKSLFGGTGNPFRVIAKQKNFGEGIWTAGNKDKKATIKALRGTR